jgi:Na+/melibiose symporter-like transporter
MIMTAVPFFFILAGIIVILFYPIDTAMHEKMVGEIKNREANSRV